MHKWISTDSGRQCYACGVDDQSGDGTGSALPCRPGGWEHPPIVLGVDGGGRILTETCAAHPYSGCAYDAAILRALSDSDAAVERSSTMTAAAMLRAEYGSSRNFMTPHRIKVGKIGPHAAYEVSQGRGFDDEPIYGLSIVLERDGETRRAGSAPRGPSGLHWSLADALQRVDELRAELRDPASFERYWSRAI